MARINWIAGQGPVLQLVEGYTVALPPEVNKVLDERTNPTWPTTWFAPLLTGRGPFRDVYSVMNNWGANHGAICYGHMGDKLISLASMLRIPVCMHNVGEERIFRPSAWTHFGTHDPGRRRLPRLRELRPGLWKEVEREVRSQDKKTGITSRLSPSVSRARR